MAKKSRGQKASFANIGKGELTLDQLDGVAGGAGTSGMKTDNDIIGDSHLTQPNALQPTSAGQGVPAPIVTGQHAGAEVVSGGTNFDARTGATIGVGYHDSNSDGMSYTVQAGLGTDASFHAGVTGIDAVAGTHGIASASVDAGSGVTAAVQARGDADIYAK